MIFNMIEDHDNDLRDLYSGDISENGQRNSFCFQTVGGVYHRYRLGHWWVPEMVLNVQSVPSQIIIWHKVINETKVKLKRGDTEVEMIHVS